MEGKDVIRILQPDIRRFSNMKTLVLLDGIPFDDHETILNYDARLISTSFSEYLQALSMIFFKAIFSR